MSGFFKIERDFMSSPFWLSEEFTKPQAWIDLIGMANYADKTKFYKGVFQSVKRGQIVTSQQALADRWKWSRHRVSDFLRTLEAANMVTTERTTHGTLVTVVNYGFYQDAGTAKGTTKGRRKDGAGTLSGHQTDIQEEIKKDINIQERENPAVAGGVPLSVEEVSAFVQEETLAVDPNAFWNYYEAVGWTVGKKPVRDWKALCRTWDGKPNYAKHKAKQQEDLDEVTRRFLEQ